VITSLLCGPVFHISPTLQHPASHLPLAHFSMSQSQPRRPSGPPATARVPSGAVVGVSETTPLLPSGVKRPASSPASAIPQSVPSYNAAPPSAAPPPAQPVAPLPRLSGLVGLDKPASTWTELGVLVRSSIPLSAGLMLENALNTINILIVGRLGPAELAVAGNSSLLIMVTGESRARASRVVLGFWGRMCVLGYSTRRASLCASCPIAASPGSPAVVDCGRSCELGTCVGLEAVTLGRASGVTYRYSLGTSWILGSHR